jgi:hypothetical protein
LGFVLLLSLPCTVHPEEGDQYCVENSRAMLGRLLSRKVNRKVKHVEAVAQAVCAQHGRLMVVSALLAMGAY